MIVKADLIALIEKTKDEMNVSCAICEILISLSHICDDNELDMDELFDHAIEIAHEESETPNV